MQCNVCRYEFTLSEIQAGAECPRCAENAKRSREISEADRSFARAKVDERAAELQRMSPSVREAVYDHRGAQPVVVVDVRMGFWSMVTFMVKWAIAAIPAGLILGFFVFGVVVGLGHLTSLLAS